MKTEIAEEERIDNDIRLLVDEADIIIENTIRKINYEIILMYWQLGKMVFEYKQENNSKHGDSVVEGFTEELSFKHGRGFGRTNIRSSVNFYNVFRKCPTSGEFENVTWSHCREIINIGNLKVINFYLKETNNKKLTVEQLRKNLKLKTYERTIINQKDGKVKNEIDKTLRDPIILNIENKKRSEKELEDEILKNIFNFMEEIGNNIALFKRQYKININGLIHKVDLVFVDSKINSYILVDLKVGKVTNKDILQMQMYIEYFGNEKNNENFNTIGLILCETKDSRLIENDNIYQIKYLNEIPKDKELLKIINENKIILLKTERLNIIKSDHVVAI